MKKSIIIVVVLIVIGLVAWYFNGHTADKVAPGTSSDTTINIANPTSVEKVSDKLSSYKNEELGFSVQYPTAWTNEASPSGVIFTAPTKVADIGENTISKLQVNIDVVPGSCTFPQVTTIKERDSIKVKDAAFSMIAMSNASQGREYFNRMYSTPKGSICYMFNFSAITSNPSTKGLSAADAAKATENNKAAITAADTAFKNLVKSFQFVVSADGDNEALHSGATK
ncbi:MAG: hypothetical protein JWO73_93 [Candidatus Taylorbacteria bacterium]|nr:hypothetical protein [Candidatus Taylorbacteria bacterium]